jgi:uncharacterized protein (TIGR03437 family)
MVPRKGGNPSTATLMVSSGDVTGAFAATAGPVISSNQSARVTASLGANSQDTIINLLATPTLSSLTCAPVKISVGSTTTCTVTMSQSAGNVSVGITSSSSALSVPGTANVAQDSTSASFTATAVSSAGGWVVVTASYNGASSTSAIGIFGSNAKSSATATMSVTQLKSLSCDGADHLLANTEAICEVEVATSGDSSAFTELQLASSNSSVRVPSMLSIPAGQLSARFRIDVVPSPEDSSSVITAQLGPNSLSRMVTLDRSGTRLNAPPHVDARIAKPVGITLAPIAPGTTFTAPDLPPGAFLDSASGAFRWIPDVSQIGRYLINFIATGSDGQSSSAQSVIDVDSGAPVITRALNAASHSRDAVCSPGAIGRLEGKWLAEGSPVSDPTGHSTQLVGTVVTVNGATVPVLAVSQSKVDFVCPAAAPGVSLEIGLQNSNGIAQPFRTISQSVTPGVYSIDESGAGQGAVVHSGTTALAMIPNYYYSSRMAFTGDLLTIYATGLANAPQVAVVVDNMPVSPTSVSLVVGVAGLYAVDIIVPAGGADEVDVPLYISVITSDGTTVASNKISVSIEKLRKKN